MALSTSPRLQLAITAAVAGPPILCTAAFGRRQRPWLDGYRALLESPGAAKVAAVSMPFNATRVVAIRPAVATSVPGLTASITTPSGFVALPQVTGDLVAANPETLLTAIMIRYLPKDRANATVVPRAAVASTLAALGWQVVTTTTFRIYLATAADRDNYIYELLVPDPATIYNPINQAQNAGNTVAAGWSALTADNPALGVAGDFFAAAVANVVASRVTQ